jgi:hypothetical protein
LHPTFVGVDSLASEVETPTGLLSVSIPPLHWIDDPPSCLLKTSPRHEEFLFHLHPLLFSFSQASTIIVTMESSNVRDEIAVVAGSTDLELAQIPASNPTKAGKEPNSSLVTFDQPYDAENPKNWTSSRKWLVTDVMSATGFNRIMVSTIMAPALSTIAAEFSMSSTESAMSLSVYLLATAFGPLVIGPLSEIYGRSVVLHTSNVWFLVWNVVCGFANSKETLIAARFLAGFGASAIYALAAGVLGDIWTPEQRGRSLGWYLLIPLLGAAVGKFRVYETIFKRAVHHRFDIVC